MDSHTSEAHLIGSDVFFGNTLSISQQLQTHFVIVILIKCTPLIHNTENGNQAGSE